MLGWRVGLHLSNLCFHEKQLGTHKHILGNLFKTLFLYQGLWLIKDYALQHRYNNILKTNKIFIQNIRRQTNILKYLLFFTSYLLNLKCAKISAYSFI